MQHVPEKGNGEDDLQLLIIKKVYRIWNVSSSENDVLRLDNEEIWCLA